MTMSSEMIVRGGVRVEEISIVWKLENFDGIISTDELIRSQHFDFQAGSTIGLPSKWSFFLSPVDVDQPIRKWIGVFLHLREAPTSVQNVCAKFTLKMSAFSGTGIASQESQNFVQRTATKNFASPKSCALGFNAVINRDFSIFTDGGFVTLHIVFKSYSELPPSPLVPSIAEQSNEFEMKSSQKVIQDLSKNLDNLASPDLASAVILLSKDGIEFPANRAILSARSPVFRQMFQAKMKESLIGVVEIDDICSQSLRLLHKYLHTGQLETSWKREDTMKDFVYGAHKYQLDLLVSFLDNVVGKVVTSLKTAIMLAALTSKLGMKTAEKELVKYIRRNLRSGDDITICEEGDYQPAAKRFKFW